MCELISTNATGMRSVTATFSRLGNRRITVADSHPGNVLQLLLAFLQRNKKDVAIEVGAEDIKHLRAADIVSAEHLDVVAGIDLKPPRLRRIAMERNRHQCDCSADQEYKEQYLDPVQRFARQRSALHRHTLLPAQKGRLGLIVKIEKTPIQWSILETAA